ncbi:MAG: thioredoxin domain-containing protein [Elusimicrobia bacterium]|nr:thioredoxin domain-containing protein [Elusimicrobiota bacterium]
MKFSILLAALAIFFPSWAPAAPSRAEVEKVISDNPDIVLGVLRSHKKEFLEIVAQAAQEEQVRRQKEEEEAEKREFEESFKNPKKPEIGKAAHVRGSKKAKYTLVEYSDFQCPFCGRGFKNVETLREKYGSKMRVVFKQLPLAMHPEAMLAAQHMEAVALQSPDKAWEFHDKLFQNQDKLGGPFYEETAKAMGLDVEKLRQDAKSQAVKDRIEADVQEAKKFGFTGTPGYLLNGVPVRGAYPVEHFDEIIKKLEGKP